MTGRPFERVFSPSASEGFEAAYRAALEGAAAFDRSELCRVRVTGRDREGFLHNMLSNDIRGLAEGAGVEATFLTQKGKLVAHLVAYKSGESVDLEMDCERVEPLVAALGRFVISEDVTLESLAGAEARFSVEGPDAVRVLSRTLEAEAGALERLEDLQFVQAGGGDGVTLVARRRDPSTRFDVIGSAQRTSPLLERIVSEGAVPASAEVAETRRIEAGRPRFGVDMDETHLPLEAGLDDAISFEKGCYIGQEYVVRLAHRGHVNKKLSGLRLEGEEVPRPGSEVILASTGAPAGAVTSACFSPRAGSSLALAYLKRDAFGEGTPVRVRWNDTDLEAIVTALPFIAPASRG